jgi:GDP-4-dehydro-6-deoxy-D-mannose reductase
MSRAFVTGAAGFAGSYLTEALLARGDQVCGLVQPGSSVANLAAAQQGPRADMLTLVSADLRDAEPLRAALRDWQPEQIYHLAGQASVRRSMDDPAETFGTNVLGTQALFEAAARAPGRPRILLVSSADAYGSSGEGGRAVREEDPLLPLSPYASSKAAAEWLGRRYAQAAGLSIVRVRPFPHTGPRQSAQFVFANLARQAAEIRAGLRPARLVVGNLEARRDLGDVRDVVRAYLLALEQGEAGTAYNICTGQTASVREVLDMLLRLVGKPVEVAVEPERLRSSDLANLVGNGDAFRQRTGWAPAIPLAQTVRDLLAYWDACCQSLDTGVKQHG